MKVRKDWLLFIAGLVWLIAGFNILYIGLQAAHGVWHFISLAAAVVVFCLFFFLIFGRLVGKHTNRILGYHDEKVWVFKFFDVKSYAIMVVMMTLGITIRKFHLMPDAYIAMFYAGLGAALLAAGAAFIYQFIKANRGQFMAVPKA